MPEPERSLTIALLLGTYPICRLDRWEELPAWALSGQFVSITRTPDELSVRSISASLHTPPFRIGWW